MAMGQSLGQGTLGITSLDATKPSGAGVVQCFWMSRRLALLFHHPELKGTVGFEVGLYPRLERY